MPQSSFRLAAAAFLLAVLGLAVDGAQAREYPYCSSEGGFASSMNCGFATLAQCRATILGAGGSCNVNPAFSGATGASFPAERRERTRRR